MALNLQSLSLVSDEDPDESELEVIVQNAREQVESLARAYENGEPIDFIDIERSNTESKCLADFKLDSVCYRGLGKLN